MDSNKVGKVFCNLWQDLPFVQAQNMRIEDRGDHIEIGYITKHHYYYTIVGKTLTEEELSLVVRGFLVAPQRYDKNKKTEEQ